MKKFFKLTSAILIITSVFFVMPKEVMAAVTFRSTSTNNGSGTTLVVAEPAGAAENDILIAIMVGGAGATHGLPSGWTQLYSGTLTSVFNGLAGYIQIG